MRNPWKGSPLAICATPIIGVLAQVVIMARATGAVAAAGGAKDVAVDVEFFGSMFLPLLAIPSLAAAVSGRNAPVHRAWYVSGIVLNGVYALLLAFPVLVFATFLIHRPTR